MSWVTTTLLPAGIALPSSSTFWNAATSNRSMSLTSNALLTLTGVVVPATTNESLTLAMVLARIQDGSSPLRLKPVLPRRPAVTAASMSTATPSTTVTPG